MDKYYWGLYEGKWQLFAADDPKEATTERSGYEQVEGPYDTREEAEDAEPR